MTESLREHFMEEHLYQHFYSDGHSGLLVDVAITLIDKTEGKDPTNRKTIE